MLQMCLLCFLLESETIFKGYVPWSLIKQYHMKYSDNWLPKPENSVTTEDYLVTSYFWTVVFIGLGLPFVIWDVSHIQVSMGVPEDSIITCCSLSSAYCHFNIIQSTFILTCFHFICLEFSPLIKIKTSSCVSVIFLSKNHKKNQVGKHKEVSSPSFCLKKCELWSQIKLLRALSSCILKPSQMKTVQPLCAACSSAGLFLQTAVSTSWKV